MMYQNDMVIRNHQIKRNNSFSTMSQINPRPSEYCDSSSHLYPPSRSVILVGRKAHIFQQSRMNNSNNYLGSWIQCRKATFAFRCHPYFSNSQNRTDNNHIEFVAKQSIKSIPYISHLELQKANHRLGFEHISLSETLHNSLVLVLSFFCIGESRGGQQRLRLTHMLDLISIQPNPSTCHTLLNTFKHF